VTQSARVFQFADLLARKGLACTWQRPAIAEYAQIEAVLGEWIHAALRGEVSDSQALTEAQNRIDAIMRKAGHY
jgi:multiple sugar transport system substrate-binding protein